MSDRSEKDRWNELADLLGLPPDQKTPGAAAPPPSPPPASPPPEAPKRRHVEPTPEFAAAEVPVRDVVEPPEPMEAPPVSPASTEREPVREEESAQEQRRGGRRRGRGQRNDGRDRDNRDRDNRSRRESPAGLDNGDAESANGEHARADSSDREEPIGRGDLDEEILEPEEAEVVEPVAEEDDDEEIDKLTDWNVPSWSELIGSLYRPER